MNLKQQVNTSIRPCRKTAERPRRRVLAGAGAVLLALLLAPALTPAAASADAV